MKDSLCVSIGLFKANKQVFCTCVGVNEWTGHTTFVYGRGGRPRAKRNMKSPQHAVPITRKRKRIPKERVTVLQRVFYTPRLKLSLRKEEI